MPGRVTDFRDYREHLALVPDVRSFPDAVEIMEFTSGAFTVEITDADNPLLDDLEANNKEPSVPYADLPCEEKEAVETKSNHHRLQAWTVLTVDDAERRLAASIDSPEVDGNEIQYAIDVQKCDLCGCSLANRGLFVDGCLRGKTTRGSMCAQCFESQGEGIGWGSGQLYARQPNGDWRMVAGFRPEQSP